MAMSRSSQEAATISSLPVFGVEDFIYDEEKDFLGSGAFGYVYKVTIEKTGQIAAAKVLVPNQRKLPRKDIQNFAKEATVLFRLEKHPNIINFFGFCDSPSCCALLLEFIHGQSLRECIDSNEDLMPWAHRLDVLHQILSGLRHLHQSKPPVTHRDLKPGNIMVQKEHGLFKCKLIDFGLSKMWTFSSQFSSGSSQYPAGTTTYVSPERWELTDSTLSKEELEMKGDIYSIGVILWEMQEMKYPFNGELPAVIKGHAKRGVLPKTASDPPSDYNNIREKCLSLHPENRPSAAEVFGLISALFGNVMSAGAGSFSSNPPPLATTTANDVASVRYFATKKTLENLKRMEEMRQSLLDLFDLQKILVIGSAKCGKSSLINSFNFVVNLAGSPKASYKEVAAVSSPEVYESLPSVTKFSKKSHMYSLSSSLRKSEQFLKAIAAGPIFADTSGLTKDASRLTSVLDCIANEKSTISCRSLDCQYRNLITKMLSSIEKETSKKDWIILFVIPATTFREKTYPVRLAEIVATSFVKPQLGVHICIAATKVDLLGDEENATFRTDIANKFCPIFKIGQQHIYPISNYLRGDMDPVFLEINRKPEKEVMIIRAFRQILSSRGRQKKDLLKHIY